MNEVVLFEHALRAAVPTRPSPTLGTTLVPRLAEVARASTIEAETHATRRTTVPPRSRFALVARVGIAVALIPLVLAGLAFAGVTVPGPARSAFESVGITLPNQPAKHAAATHGQGATHGGRPSARPRATPQGPRQGAWTRKGQGDRAQRVDPSRAGEEGAEHPPFSPEQQRGQLGHAHDAPAHHPHHAGRGREQRRRERQRQRERQRALEVAVN
jgi:hypothetical protein